MNTVDNGKPPIIKKYRTPNKRAIFNENVYSAELSYITGCDPTL
jgi:hypothetical protein